MVVHYILLVFFVGFTTALSCSSTGYSGQYCGGCNNLCDQSETYTEVHDWKIGQPRSITAQCLPKCIDGTATDHGACRSENFVENPIISVQCMFFDKACPTTCYTQEVACFTKYCYLPANSSACAQCSNAKYQPALTSAYAAAKVVPVSCNIGPNCRGPCCAANAVAIAAPPASTGTCVWTNPYPGKVITGHIGIRVICKDQ